VQSELFRKQSADVSAQKQAACGEARQQASSTAADDTDWEEDETQYEPF